VSVPATEMGGVGSVAPTNTTQPTSSATPATGTSNPQSWVSGLLDSLNPLSGLTSGLGNIALIAVGVVLALGALLISQKETVVQVASTAAKAGAV
jgi:hypothetical protein